MDKYADEEFEIQYFGFSSVWFIQELHTAVSNLMKTVAEFMKSCVSPDKTDEEKRFDYNIIEAFHSESEKLIKKTVHNLKPKIHAFFAIPKNVSLEADRKTVSTQHDSKKAVEKLEEEIALLEQQYMKQGAFIYMCEKELEILESLEPIKEKVGETGRKLQALIAANRVDKMQKLTEVYEKFSGEFNINQCLAFESR